MDINNDLQQINTFTKGMNTDVSDMLMDSSQYRYAENVRLVTNTDSNSGELRLVDGTREFADALSDFESNDIKAMTSIRNMLIIVNTDDEIWVCQYPNLTWDKVFLPDEGEHFGDYLSLVTRWETPNLIKLYIADGEHQLMYINLCDGVQETITGIDNIIANPAVFLGKLEAERSSQGGILGPVKIQYVYRRYKEGGAATTLSPFSNVVTLYKKPNEGYSTVDEYGGHAIDVTFIFNDLLYDAESIAELKNIQLYRLTYKEVGLLPSVDLVYDGPIPSTNKYVDVGSSVEEMSFTELSELIKLDIVPKVIESKEDYLFAANIKYNQDELDLQTDITAEKCRAYSSGDLNENNQALYSSYNKQFLPDNISTYNLSFWRPVSRSNANNIIGGDGEIFSWTLIEKEVYIDTKNNKYFMVDGSLEQTQEQLSSLRSGEVYRYGAIFYDKKGNKTNAKWIADIMIPELSVAQKVEIGDNIYYKMHQVGIRVDINNAQTLLDSDWCGVEIVRSVRTVNDRISITRGICGYPYKIYKSTNPSNGFSTTKETGYICPTGYFAQNIFTADSAFSREDGFKSDMAAVTDPSYIMFASPEYVYSPDTIQTLLDKYKGLTYVDFKYKNSTRGVISLNGGANINVPQTISGIDEDLENGEFGQLAGTYTTVLSSDTLSNRPFWFGLWKIDQDNGDVRFEHSNIKQLISRQNYNFNSDEQNATHYCWSYNLDSALENYHCKQKGLPLVMIYERVFDDEAIGNMSLCNPYADYINISNDDPIDIQAVAYPEVPEYNSFFDETFARGATEDITPIESRDNYIGWSAPLLMGIPNVIDHMRNEDGFMGYASYWGAINQGAIAFNLTMLFTGNILGAITNAFGTFWVGDILGIGQSDVSPVEKRFPVFYPIGSTGKCIVMKLDKPGKVSGSHILNFHTVDIRKKVANPYGGRAQVDYSSYVSSGNMIDLVSGDTSRPIYDGDSYPGVFVYNASHAWYEPNTPGGVRQATIYVVPLESDVDLSATYGDLYTNIFNNYKHYVLDVTCEIQTAESMYSLSRDAYWYNAAYGAITNGLLYNAVKQSSIKKDLVDVRVHHSQEKKNGDSIDNWLDFRANNFIDVDTRYGAITNMRLFKDKLLFWQNYASGVLGVNERTVLNDIDENQIVVGTGGVLQRFDYISTVHGMKPNQYEAEVLSNTTQYWWDGYNKEILAYSGGLELFPLAKLKSVTNFINSNQEVVHPSLAYDVKYNELISNVVNGGSLAYNEHVQQFTSVYTFMPIFRSRIGNDLLLATYKKIFRWNDKLSSDPNSSVLFGEPAKPKVKYVVNKSNAYNKVFDITTFGGRFYGGDDAGLNTLSFVFDTPLKQHSTCTGSNFITNREYDFRLAIPRNNNDSYGGRMRGKTMQCELSSSSNSTDFSLQYIITKYRMSWS